MANEKKEHEKIHIFINGIKFDETQGIKPVMRGKELAALVFVPEDNADIRRKNSDVEIGLEEDVQLKNGDHFEIIRKRVDAGFSNPPDEKELYVKRIEKEVSILRERTGVNASYFTENGSEYVLYEGIETGGKTRSLPEKVDVLTRVPNGYPTAHIDMPALQIDSKLLPHVVGISNPQGDVKVKDKIWRFVSFHPYSNPGGPVWNPSLHGFHDYCNQLYIWLHKLS